MPGSGKSAIGKAVARRLDLPFVDCDLSIERQAGCSIADFFERNGEEAFRTLEMETIAALVSSGPSVLATGGGVVLRERNRELLRARTLVGPLKTPRGEPLDLIVLGQRPAVDRHLEAVDAARARIAFHCDSVARVKVSV